MSIAATPSNGMDESRIGLVIYHCTSHDWFGRHHFFTLLARAFARRARVLYVSTPVVRPIGRGIRPVGRRIRGGYLSEQDGVTVLQPILPNGARFRSVRLWRHFLDWIVARATRSALNEIQRREGEKTLLWCYAPDALPLVRSHGFTHSVYWCGDDSQLPDEDRLIREVDLVFAISPPVLALNRKNAKRITPMPMAVEPEPYIRARMQRATPTALHGLPRPLIGYAGALNRRIDWALLEKIAEMVEGTMVLVGPVIDSIGESGVARLVRRSKVRWVGHQSEIEAPRFIAAFDVALMPYRRIVFNESCNPTKFYEYLAAGVPVVSTMLPILDFFDGFARQACDAEGFIEAIHASLNSAEHGPEAIGRRQETARHHSYDRLVALIESEVHNLDLGAYHDTSPADRWGPKPS